MVMIGDRIKAERRKAGLTQRDLAILVGVDRSAVGQWESNANRKNITSENLVKVASVLNISVDRLAGNDRGDGLGSFESELVRLFRLMPTRKQSLFLDLFRVSVGLDQPVESKSYPMDRQRSA